jgi:3-oxoacyl-[acyl-carrier-protein] synthase-3
VLSNEQLAQLYPDWTAEKIYEKTGIRERHVVQEGECASDLAYAAAKRVLSEKITKSADFLLFCTQTPDYLLPTTACVLQHRLGLPTSCAALDFNLGCSGYVYGLSLANSLLQSGAANKVLLLTADTYSRLIHPLDKSTRTIFGDAGTATLLSKDSKARLHSFVLGSDGSGADQLMVKTGGARHSGVFEKTTSVDDSGNVRDPECLYMNGPEIFNFTIKAVPKLVQGVLDKAKLTLDEVDLVVFHQANAFMLEHLRRKLGIPSEKFMVHLEFCGNTVSSTIPLTLEEALKTGRMRPGMKVLLAGFGVGYSWGGCILEWR